jgi:uncharacterized membrane protein YdjX (TVP38/TMEM64 family)
MTSNIILNKKWLPLIILLVALGLFYFSGWSRYLSFAELKQHREQLTAWTQTNFALAALIFTTLYTLSIAVSIPGATFFTLAGGFLFGIIWGSILVVISATLGATIIFLAVRTALAGLIAKRASGWIEKMRRGFQDGAFEYLLVLRFVPLFPFWVVNIVPGLLGVSTRTYVVATFLGIIPGSIVYVMLGNGLGYFFDQNQTPDLGIIFQPRILLPLIALGVLSIIPVIYKSLKRKKQ